MMMKGYSLTMIKKYFDIKLLIVAIFSSAVTSLIVVNLIVPCKLYPAGYSGISRIISDISLDYFNFEINYSIIYFVLNLLSCALCFKYIGKKFTIYSFIQFSLTSLFTFIFKPLNIPFDFENDLLLIIIFGGI